MVSVTNNIISVEQIKQNLRQVRERIASAAKRAGYNPDEILLIGATKSVKTSHICSAIEAGLQHIGENYAQEASAKYKQLGDLANLVSWHFIGHLQTNKVKSIIHFFQFVQSLDRMSLAEELSKRADKIRQEIFCLVQVNIGREMTKGGIDPDSVEPFIRQVAKFSGIRIVGLMAIPPYFPDPESVRPYFRQMKNLFNRLKNLNIHSIEMRYLSMGMSYDFEVAIEEGANMVRIGTAIFGPRPTY